MNFGIIISYIVAGILMISILTVSNSMSHNSSELTTTQIKKLHGQSVQEMVSFDIPKIGYQQLTTLSTKFATADSSTISFYSNLDNSDDESVEQITWTLTTTADTETGNPDDYILRRTVDGADTDIRMGVTDFEIRYYDEYGGSTPMATPVSSGNFDDIRQIEITVTMASGYSVDTRPGVTRYITSTWTKRFSPVNLRED